MKPYLRLLSVALLAPCLLEPASSQEAVDALAPQSSKFVLSLDLLSDTRGANFGPYMKRLVSDLRSQWMLSTEAIRQTSGTGEEALIRLTLAPDGHILAMKMEGVTKDSPLDQAAWNAAKATAYPPLPAGMQDANLMLRVHFVAK